MKIRYYAVKAILIIALSASFGVAQNMIFDFGGVLVLTDKFTSLRHIGMINIAQCSIQLGLNPFSIDIYIKSRCFSILDEIAAIHNLVIPNLHQAYDEKGNPLPLLMNAWLQGLMSTTRIIRLIENTIENHPEWFKCAAEKRVITNTIALIFTPQLLVNSCTIDPACIAFIKLCKKEGHKIYGLSNWDTASFKLLRQKHADAFDLFDGIIISADVKANKPHTTIYQILLDRYQLEAKQCWFIDDQRVNIDAARTVGINAIQHTSTFKNLIKNIRQAQIAGFSHYH